MIANIISGAEMQASEADEVVRLLESRSEDAVGVAIGAMLRLLSGLGAGANVRPLAEAGAFRAVAVLLKSSVSSLPSSDDSALTPFWAISPLLIQRLNSLVDRAMRPIRSLLSRGRTPKEWEVASLALQSLTLDKGSCVRIAAEAFEAPGGTLWLLSELLAQGSAAAKQRAAGALVNLADGGHRGLAELGPVGGRLLELLVRNLSERIPEVQEAAAWALGQLTKASPYARNKVGHIEGGPGSCAEAA